MLTQYNLKMPHAVYGGENAMDNITAIIKARGAKKVAMFTDKGIEGAGLFALPEEAVKASGAEYYVLDELPPEPSYMAVQKLVDEFKVSGADLIVACGGGSVMDAAKLASVLVTDAYGVKELLDNPGMAQKCVPIVLIPTTAGTGSECTPFTIISDANTGMKWPLIGYEMMPEMAIVDADNMMKLPPRATQASGYDVLTHAVEAYVSTAATPMTDACAEKAMEYINRYLRRAVANGKDMEAREGMCYAQYLAGMAFNNASLGHVHAMAHQLGGFYDLPHGECNAILLPHVCEYNLISSRRRFGRIAKLLGERVDGLSPTDASQAAIKAIRILSKDVGIPEGLIALGKKYGKEVKEEDIPTMTANAQKDACGLTNPRKMTDAAVQQLYEIAF